MSTGSKMRRGVQDWDPDKPFNDLPKLPPTSELEDKAVLKQCLLARVELAKLSQAVFLIPDARILVTSFPLMEAQASSEIENVVTTTESMLRHVRTPESGNAPTREALRYFDALLAAAEELKERPVGIRMAESICARIRGTEMGLRKNLRVAISNERTREVIYTPPVGESLINDLLANWEEFIHLEESLDPLVRIAVGHYQFEAIHPFTDGNGRTGRVLNSVLFVAFGLIPIPVLYLSRFLIANRDEYYQRLHDVTRDGAWQSWILFMLRGVSETAAMTTSKIYAVRELLTKTLAHVQRNRLKGPTRELVEMIFRVPVCKISHLVESGIAKRETASRYLHALKDIGVLEELVVGREKQFVHSKLFDLITRESSSFEDYGDA